MGPRNQPASEPVTLGRRGAARARLALPGRMVTFDGTTSCMILDVSQTGAQIGCDEPPRVGAMAVIEFPPIEFFGNVAWALDTRFGMHFDEPLDQEMVIELRRQADSYDRSERRHLLKMAEEFVTGRAK
ncbi:PilZ domain-containing protein [Altererythrobacter lutimaris]|uniref:PilZ domain-containing protein n=1 Tax=Altererythrobacter lutimaris TaxID=2743979 RepID=A0A850H941_9SPHN|nr:PilZ domain-containing protein [Altererythrobacter lutimaris]NVE93416.1 PilZ domain-containing protein [Altererythrobacter lutimaris]